MYFNYGNKANDRFYSERLILMSIITKRNIARILIVVSLFGLLLPISSAHAVDNSIVPRASDYLDSYNAYIYPAALGKVQVWFTVTGDDYMDDIGALTVKIYESTDNETWTWVKTYTNGNTPTLLGHDVFYYSSHVDYQGTIGRYYKAYVTIWAGKDGDGDTRYMWTQPKKATLFAG